MASWSIVEGADPYYRGLTVATILRDALAQRLSESEQRAMPPMQAKNEKKKNGKDGNQGKSPEAKARRPGPAESITVLSGLDMTRTLDKATYQQTLPELQAQLHLLHLRAKEQGVSSILVFEGVDAAGKGGAIRRIQEGWSRATTRSTASRRRPRRSWRSTTSGASGGSCRRADGSRSSTAPGTAGCWSSGSRALPPKTNGAAPMPRSTTSKAS